MCIWCAQLSCTIAQSWSINLPSYPPDNHHSSDVVCWRGGLRVNTDYKKNCEITQSGECVTLTWQLVMGNDCEFCPDDVGPILDSGFYCDCDAFGRDSCCGCGDRGPCLDLAFCHRRGDDLCPVGRCRGDGHRRGDDHRHGDDHGHRGDGRPSGGHRGRHGDDYNDDRPTTHRTTGRQHSQECKNPHHHRYLCLETLTVWVPTPKNKWWNYSMSSLVIIAMVFEIPCRETDTEKRWLKNHTPQLPLACVKTSTGPTYTVIWDNNSITSTSPW